MTGPGTITEAAAALRAGETTSVAIVERALARAEKFDHALGAFITRFDDEALAAASAADVELSAGTDQGPLHGIPIAIKDLLSTREGPTTAGSSAQDPELFHRADSTVVARLRAAGAVIIGKASLAEYAVGVPDLTKPFPVPRNPWAPDHWAGGSSGGSANAVAAGLALGAIGTDTGGSVRLPAAFCGITGLKTTWGSVNLTGCIPLAWSFDTVGPMARSAADCRLILDVIRDAPPGGAPDELADLGGLRIGYDRLAAVTTATDDGHVEAFDLALATLAEAGAELVELPLPDYATIVAANQVVLLCEGLTHHLDGLRARWLGYGRATRQFLLGGLAFTGPDYVQAQRIRARSWQQATALFRDVDFHLSPVATIGAPALDDLLEGDRGRIFGSTHTQYWSAVGVPAVAIPIGFTNTGLPLSMQIAGAAGRDHAVLAVAEVFQSRTDFHLAEAKSFSR
ncbi:amidase [Amycolatopsis sp. K13G38]|uniref:Amidase n=1 Tax=Amycolatopsis acididurans TaxID=2724524 RepID=A0ABX1JEA1_9PSEU|nr:amidase [Amycolatopsis acididurans]NKQ58064.1 amidase [Amycolatopsis acididurans]